VDREQISAHHFGIGIAVLVGFIAALAATMAIVARRNMTEDRYGVLSDDQDEVLGI
jgi:hypothetical protein